MGKLVKRYLMVIGIIFLILTGTMACQKYEAIIDSPSPVVTMNEEFIKVEIIYADNEWMIGAYN